MSKQKSPIETDERELEWHSTPHGTKYKDLGFEGHVSVYPDCSFTIDKDRLFLFEDFLAAIGDNFDFFARDAIVAKMDSDIRNANMEEIGKRVKDRFLKKWIPAEHENRPSTLVQRPINKWG